MKTSNFKRVLLFLHWIVSVLLMLGLVLGVSLLWRLSSAAEIAFIVLIAALLAALSGSVFWILYKSIAKEIDHSLVTIESSETGRIAISINALEQMTKQAVAGVDGISDMKIAITSEEEAIDIGVNITLVGGSHVPTVTMNMQRAIRQFVEMNCGVSVRSVSVSIDAVTNVPEPGKKGKRADKGLMPVFAPIPVPGEEVVEEATEEYAEEVPAAEEVVEDCASEEPADEPEIELVLVDEPSAEVEAPAEELYNEVESVDAEPTEEADCADVPAEEETSEKIAYTVDEAFTEEESAEDDEAEPDPLAEFFPAVDEVEEENEPSDKEPEKILE